MATVLTASKAVAPAKAAAAKAAGQPKTALSPAPSSKAIFRARTVSNGVKTRQMLVWTPVNNKCFETLSYLPPLTPEQISKQVDYIVRNGWTPCLEFAPEEGDAYIASGNCIRFGPVSSGYYDNRYWTMWKLPMFGCTEGASVLQEISACEKCFPNAYIRLVAFDNKRQVQILGFLVHRPSSATEFTLPDRRSVS